MAQNQEARRVAEVARDLDDWLEFEERAAIKEFCGNMSREEAERQARLEVEGKP